MNSTFKLKKPKGDKPTLIYFRAYFKKEGKSLIYSTGESIHPKDWDFENNCPNNLSGRKSDAQIRRSINQQLNRYTNLFQEIVARYRNLNEELTISKAREHLDEEFKENRASGNKFLAVYDQFLKDKKQDQSGNAIGKSTLKRYEYNKKLLQSFQEETKTQLRFDKINNDFFNDFVEYCIKTKKHSNNTLSRNIGLLKTFLFWALKNKHTYNDQFTNFKNIKRFKTDEVALTLDQVKKIANADLSKNKRLERVRDLFVLGCACGLRFGNYSKIKKNDIQDGFIKVIDIKDNSKSLSIPLNPISKSILEKYDYDLPKISNQKFNKYLKDLFQELEYNEVQKKVTKLGDKIIEKESILYDRISSHTSRRSFITIMKNQKVPDKVIMSYTGHKSLEVFNNYYRPNEDDKVNFMNNVFK